jgi:hypothetical protein
MTSSVSPAMGQPARNRVIAIRTIDSDGNAARKAKVTIRIGGEEMAAFVVGDKPTATLELDEVSIYSLELTAVLNDETLQAVLSPDGNYTFQFSQTVPRGFAPVAGKARCVDGTTGVPCVTCRAGAGFVRICV